MGDTRPSALHDVHSQLASVLGGEAARPAPQVDVADYLLEPPISAEERARRAVRARWVRRASVALAGLIAVLLLVPLPSREQPSEAVPPDAAAALPAAVAGSSPAEPAPAAAGTAAEDPAAVRLDRPPPAARREPPAARTSARSRGRSARIHTRSLSASAGASPTAGARLAPHARPSAAPSTPKPSSNTGHVAGDAPSSGAEVPLVPVG
jgi:hypothetical protein